MISIPIFHNKSLMCNVSLGKSGVFGEYLPTIGFSHEYLMSFYGEQASVAHVHPTGDQAVAGLTPVESATFFHGD